VGVDDECVKQFNDLKLKHNLKYIVYGMNKDMTQIQVLKTAGPEANYDQFKEEFPDGECRYGVFDAEYTDPKTGGQRNKIVFYIWCPDSAKVRPKMIYASSKDELKKRLVGVATEVQASDKSEMEYSEVRSNNCSRRFIPVCAPFPC